MLALMWNGKLALCFGIEKPGATLAGQRLSINLFLQRDQRLQQRLGARGASWDVYIDRNVAIDALQYVVSLLERSARDGASSHRDHVSGFSHLVIEPNNLGRHLLG